MKARVLLLFGFVFTAEGAQAAAVVAKLLLIVAPHGEVQIQSGNGRLRSTRRSGMLGLDTNSPIYKGDVVVTRGDARVKIGFFEGNGVEENSIVLGQNSSLVIEAAASSDEMIRGRKGTSLLLHEGELRSSVRARYTGQGSDSYEVRTANAVAGVRGTQFTVEYRGTTQETRVAVSEGKVNFASLTSVSQTLVGSGLMSSLKASQRGVEAPRPVPTNLKYLLTPVAKLDPHLSASDMPAASSSASDLTPPPGALDRETSTGERSLNTLPAVSTRTVQGSQLDDTSVLKREDPFAPAPTTVMNRFGGQLPLGVKMPDVEDESSASAEALRAVSETRSELGVREH